MAVRFKGKVFTFTQPDGSKIQLRGSGNQYHAVFETLDGYAVLGTTPYPTASGGTAPLRT